MILIQYTQESCDMEIAEKILALEHTAWPGNEEGEAFPSAPNTYAASFLFLEQDTAICHVGIRKSPLFHNGQAYIAYGLSEVVTHPDWQKRGLASALIQKAAQFVIAQHPDISIFTCEQSRVPFYTRGGWEAVKGACFVGGTKDKPFRSDQLNLATMMMFLSPKGRLHRHEFEHADIVFELGENQLW